MNQPVNPRRRSAPSPASSRRPAAPGRAPSSNRPAVQNRNLPQKGSAAARRPAPVRSLPPRAPQRRKKKSNGKKLFFGFVLFALIVAVVVILIQYHSRVYQKVEVEAGYEGFSALLFAKNENEAAFQEGFSPESVDLHVPGEYEVKLQSGIFRYTSTLVVRDTVPPAATAAPCSVSFGENCRAEDLIKDLTDATKVECRFESTPDFSKLGKQSAAVILRDLGGNETRIQSEFTVVPLRAVLEREAGSQKPQLSDFLLPNVQIQKLELVSEGEDLLSTEVPGDYPIRFSADGLICDCIFRVTDTTPPVFTVKNLTLGVGVQVKAEYFVSDCSDRSKVTYSARFTAPLDSPGEQQVTVSATDAYGNTAEKTANLKLVSDTAAPVIRGVRAQTVYVGKTASYLTGVEVTDELDPDPKLDVDTSKVDLKKEGEYPVVYIATDAAGNRSEAKTTLSVITSAVNEEAVMAKAKEILDSILTPEMSQLEQLRAIYRWIRNHIAYRDAPSNPDWLQAAYFGMTNHYGDCSVYQMTSRALLTAAGIENRLIDSLPLYQVHAWNLVNIGEGWYHFDATPFLGGGDFCYIDSATLAARSTRRPESHSFDPDLYPEVL